MSYQVGAACYGTATEAAQASASAMGGAVVSHAGGAYLVEVDSASDGGISYLLHPVGGGSALVLSSPYQAQPCALLSTSDGLQLGWLVLGVWASVWGVMFLARSLYASVSGGAYGES